MTFSRMAGGFNMLSSAVARLALPAHEQIAYLEQLGTAPSTDELALEFDDSYKSLAARWRASGDHAELLELVTQIDAALAVQQAWTVEDLDSDSWDEIRSLARAAIGIL